MAYYFEGAIRFIAKQHKMDQEIDLHKNLTRILMIFLISMATFLHLSGSDSPVSLTSEVNLDTETFETDSPISRSINK